MKTIKMIKKYAVNDFKHNSPVGFYLLKKDGTYTVTTCVDFDYNLDDVIEAYARLSNGTMEPITPSVYEPEKPLSVGKIVTIQTKDRTYTAVFILSQEDDEIRILSLKSILEDASITCDYPQPVFLGGYPISFLKFESCLDIKQTIVIKYKDIEFIEEDVL